MFLKILTGLIMLWPLATFVVLGVDAWHISSTGQEWSQWLGARKFFPVAFPVLLVLSTFVPMVVSIVKRSVSAKSYPTWQWFIVLLAPIALPVFWYRFVWKDDKLVRS
jgi:hypothetical protein